MHSLFFQIEAFLLDFDGTLARLNIDFKALKGEILALAASFGLNDPLLPDPPYLLELTLALKEQLQDKKSPEGEAFYTQAMSLIDQREWEAASPENLFPSTPMVLKGLHEKGVKIAVLTRNSGKSVYRVFPDLDEYIDAFLPREKVQKPKPDSGHLRQAMELLKVAPEKTVMVGDHPIDILSGKEAGTLTIGVLSGRIQETEMRTAGADLVLADIGLLLDLLKD
ncbi:MAG: haloacid dehalogenase [Desulfobacca sp.]|nr:haloacid dehalogenase [Desulfobacca sp.]